MGNRTTIQDIADEAGVSKATVSYILNNKPGKSISPATRAAVLAAAKKLQYFPSHSARALSGGSAGCIAVVVMGEKLKNYRFAGILSGLRSALAREGLDNVLLCSGRMRGEYTDYISNYLEGRVDGIVFIRTANHVPDEKSLALVRQRGIPFVAVDCGLKPHGFSTVELNYAEGAEAAAEYLLKNAPGKLVYLRPREDNLQEQQRQKGVCAAAGCCGADRLEIRWFTSGDQRENLENTALFQSIMENIQDIKSGDAVLFSWRDMAQIARLTCVQQGKAIQIGELSFSYAYCNPCDCALSIREATAGKTAAEEILRLVRGESARCVAVSPQLLFPGTQQLFYRQDFCAPASAAGLPADEEKGKNNNQ